LETPPSLTFKVEYQKDFKPFTALETKPKQSGDWEEEEVASGKQGTLLMF
jgi:hypothetical protein